jgi:hypothetical protein
MAIAALPDKWDALFHPTILCFEFKQVLFSSAAPTAHLFRNHRENGAVYVEMQ